MKRMILHALLATGLGAMPLAASSADAERLRMSYQLRAERWMLETRLASTVAELEAAERNRPDPQQAARDMWRVLSGNLDQAWVLPHAAWFINLVDSLNRARVDAQPFMLDELNRLIEAITRHHQQSPDLVGVCMALAQGGGPERLTILERIRNTHPRAEIRGVASLALSIAMKALGDEPAVLRKRLDLLRDAIIHSADVSLHEETTVAMLAEEELYIIRNLTKGRTAPDLVGTDNAGRTMRLSDHAGKAVVLLFWNGEDVNAREIIEFTTAMQARMRGRPVEIIGVHVGAAAVLRPMEADGRVVWRNFSDPAGDLLRQYRVATLPLCFVLDKNRTIQHIGPPGSFVEMSASALASDIEESKESDG